MEIRNIKCLIHACRKLKQCTSTQGMRMTLCLLPCYTKFRQRSIICPSYHILYWKDIFFCYIFVCMQVYRGWYTYDPFNNRFWILWHECRWSEICHFVNDISQLPYQQYSDNFDKLNVWTVWTYRLANKWTVRIERVVVLFISMRYEKKTLIY